MLQLCEVMLLTEMLSENVHLEVLEMAGNTFVQGTGLHVVDFLPYFTAFTTSCLYFSPISPFCKGVYSKRKELAPKGSKFFPFKVNPFSDSQGRQKSDKIYHNTYFLVLFFLVIRPILVSRKIKFCLSRCKRTWGRERRMRPCKLQCCHKKF